MCCLSTAGITKQRTKRSEEKHPPIILELHTIPLHINLADIPILSENTSEEKTSDVDESTANESSNTEQIPA